MKVIGILERFDSRRASLEALLDRAFADGRDIDPRDRRLVNEIVCGILRHRTQIDYVIDQFITDPRARSNQYLRRVLELGVYQLVHMDRIPEHAAVNETVACAKSNRNTRAMGGLVNGVLRNVIRAKGKLPRPREDEELAVRLSVTHSHPEWLVRRWLANFGLARTRKLMEFNNRRPETYLRRRSRGISRQQFEAAVRAIAEPVGGLGNLYYRVTKPVAPDSIAVLRDGQCVVQAPSSGWVVAVLGLRNGESVLDVCSAPGGKATLCAELVGRGGAVCACEIRMHRMARVARNVESLGLDNVYLVLCNGTRLPFTGAFDKVLLDAPCSATGVMHRHPDARWVREDGNIAHAAEAQARLLDGAVPFVRPGGVLVYSTCSVEPEENEMQVRAFLSRHDEFGLDPVPDIVPSGYVDADGFLRITPFDDGVDGMFAARMVRRC